MWVLIILGWNVSTRMALHSGHPTHDWKRIETHCPALWERLSTESTTLNTTGWKNDADEARVSHTSISLCKWQVTRHNTGCLSEVTGTFKEKTHDSMLFNHALLNLWVCPVHLSCREGQNSWILLPLCSYKSPLSFQFLSVWPMLWSDRKWACLYLKSKAARRFSQSKFLKAKTWFQIQEKYVIKKNAS